MGATEFNIYIPVVLIAVITGVVFMDFGMSYLQGQKDPWRISITLRQAIFHLALLLAGGGAGFLFGHSIGLDLKYYQPSEPIIIGGMFAFVLTGIVRGYTMLYFHKVNEQGF